MIKQRLSAGGALLVSLGIAAAILGFSVGQSTARAALTGADIVDFAFDPVTITIPAGDQVRWTNTGDVPHTVTSTGLFNSGTLNTNDTFTYTFGLPGTYTYFCTIHTFMQGSVTVTGPTATSTLINTPTNTSTPTVTNTSIPTNTPTQGTPTVTATATSTATPTLTPTITFTPTVQTPVNTPTPISPIPDATSTNTPLPPAPTAPATPTRTAPLPPNTGNGSGGDGAIMLFVIAGLLIAAGGSLGAAAYVRHR